MAMIYQPPRSAGDETDRTLWMGDLNPNWDAAFITEAFARMGEQVINVKIVNDKHSGKQAGYCFVEFTDREAARRAMLHINGKIIPKSKPGSAFNLSFANSPSAPYTEYNLFVNNVPPDMDDAALFLIFGERYESCRGAKVYRNVDGTSKGLGFVRFSDQTDQQRALLEMNKYRVDGRQLLLKLAQPKFRAPRQGRGLQPQQGPGYKPPNYHTQSLNQSSVTKSSPYYSGSGNTSSTTTAYSPYSYGNPKSSTVNNRPVYYPVIKGDTILEYDTGGVAAIGDLSAEESNEDLLEYGEEFYDVMDDIVWSKAVFEDDTTEDDLMDILA